MAYLQTKLLRFHAKTQRRKEKRAVIGMYLGTAYHSNLWRICRLMGEISHKERKGRKTFVLFVVIARNWVKTKTQGK